MAPSGSPVTGSLPPMSIRTEPGAAAPPPAPRPNPPLFWSRRFGCQAVSSPICSGNAFGSPASLNASMARIAEAVWWPWPPPCGENRVITTSGRKVRITRTMSDTTPLRSQIRSVSCGFLEKPKSMARVKNCRPPSRRRAASSSWVRITPSSSKSSGPITFWPPSPRVSERYAVR